MNDLSVKVRLKGPNGEVEIFYDRGAGTGILNGVTSMKDTVAKAIEAYKALT